MKLRELKEKLLTKGYFFKEHLKSKIRERKLKRNKNNYNLKDLFNDFKELGIKKGDIVLVHSSLKSIGYVKGGAKTVIRALKKAVGSDGTLAFPTYPMRGGVLLNCRKGDFIFDPKNDKAKTGAIPNTFLNFKDIHRSLHPSHSISALGKYADYITKDHHRGNKTYGENSPWGKIYELEGKILGIGISIAWSTQYHYLEDKIGKKFPLKVKVDETYNLKTKIGEEKYIEVVVQPNDPKVAETRIEKNPFILNYLEKIYKNLNVLHTGKVGNAVSWWFNLKDFIDILEKLAKMGITIYSTEEELKRRGLFPYSKIESKLN
jgi:aminoglycoside 3-N-acetyltransferase